MTSKYPAEVVEQWIKGFRQERCASEVVIARIDKGMTYWAGAGSSPLTEVTQDMLAEHKERIARLDRLIAQYDQFKE